MLTIFPNLLDYSFYVPLVLRLFLGLYFFVYGMHALGRIERSSSGYRGSRAHFNGFTGSLAVLSAVSIIIGFLTQAGAILAMILSVYLYLHNHHRRAAAYLLFAMSFSLLLSGAGPLAFDVPL